MQESVRKEQKRSQTPLTWPTSLEMLRTGVAVEKLVQQEFAKIGSRQEALQTISPSLLNIFYCPIFDFFLKPRLFQQPQGLSLAISA